MSDPSPVRVIGEVYADPASVFTWGLYPALRRVEERFGPAVHIDWRMGGAFDDLAAFRRSMRLDGAALGEWLRAATRRTGLPVDPEFLTNGRLPSSFPAARAVVAVERIDPGRSAAFLRRLTEFLQVRGLPFEEETLAQCARDVGLDPGRARAAREEPATEAAFARARTAMENGHRNFEEVEWRTPEGGRARVEEEYAARRHEEAIERLVPGLPRRIPAGVAEYALRRGDLLHAHEVGTVFGWSDAEAEKELEALWRRGEVARWSLPAGTFWTARQHRSRAHPR